MIGLDAPPVVVVASSVPRARPGADAVVVDGEAVVREGGAIHVLNPTAALVWQCCDGDVSVGTLARELADAFGASATVVEHDVIAIVTNLAALGLVDVDPPRRDVGPPRRSGAPRRLLEPSGGCAGCGAGPQFEVHVLIEAGDLVLSVGADRGVADALVAVFGRRVVDRRDDPGPDPPVYGVVIPAGDRSRGVQPVARLHRGSEVLVHSRSPERVLRALVAQLATHAGAAGLAPLDALAVGRPGSGTRPGRVVLVPVPANRVGYERAAAALSLAVADAAVAFVGADPPRVVVGAPERGLDLAPLLHVAAGRLHLGPEPSPLPWGEHELAGLALPDAPTGPAAAARALAELGPRRRDGVDPAPALATLLALLDRVPIATGVAPAAVRSLLDRGRGARA